MATTEYEEILERVFANLPGDQAVFRPGRIELERHTVQSSDEVRQALDDFEADCGWVETTDSLRPWRGETQEGIPLNAELAGSDQSLTVRRGAGQWVLLYSSIEDAEFPDQLVQVVTHRARRGFPTLRYQVAWRCDERGELHPCASHPAFITDEFDEER